MEKWKNMKKATLLATVMGLISMTLLGMARASPTNVIQTQYLFDNLGRNYAYWNVQHLWVLNINMRNPFNTTQPANVTIFFVNTLFELKGTTLLAYQEISLALTLYVDMIDPSLSPYKIEVQVEFPSETFTWTLDFYVRWPGDASGDGWVDVSDLALLAEAWYTKAGDANFDTGADFNADGIIDVSDLAVLAEYWYTGIT